MNFLVVCLYVDDMIYKKSCESITDEFKSCLLKKFKMSKGMDKEITFRYLSRTSWCNKNLL